MTASLSDDELVRHLQDEILQRCDLGTRQTSAVRDWCLRARESVYYLTEDLIDPDHRERARILLLESQYLGA